MAKTLSKTGITTTNTIEAWHVSQSVDALTGTDAYDITVSGSLTVEGPVSGSFTGSFSGSIDGSVTSASYASSSTSASYAATATSASHAITSSYALTALSASYAPGGGGGGTPGGLNTQVQFNDGGAFGGDAGLTYNKTTDVLTGVTASFEQITAAGELISDGTITAAGNISSSGTVTGLSGSFSHLTGNSPITVTSPIISQLNSTKVVEVTHSGDFPTPVGTQITLEENTTYLIRGNINMSDTLFASGSGISLFGVDRNRDTLTYTSSSTFITVENSDFTIKDLKLSATNTSSLLISGSDYTSGSFNQGRDKVFEIVNSQFRNCGNVADFKGYDLIDINNTLFFYVQAPTIGVRFTDTSKTEISSCEFIRWYDETSNPSPSGYSTAPMIEFADTGSEGAGFGATNINGCIIHPQVQQDGIRIATGSTTSFGTISSNAFVNANLTTGSVFYPTNVQGLPDYSLVSTKKYDVFANQGILNSTSGVVMTVSNNTTQTNIVTQNVAVPISTSIATNRASVRYEVSGSGRATYIGSKQVYVSLHASLDYTKAGGGTDDFTFYMYKNGGLLSGSGTSITAGGSLGAVSLNYGTLMTENDYVELYVENNDATSNIIISNLQLVVRE